MERNSGSIIKNLIASVIVASGLGYTYNYTLSETNITENQIMLYKIAKRTFPENLTEAQLATAQAILESNLSGKPSNLAKKYNNLFGITGKGTNGSVYFYTKEYEHYHWITTKRAFAWNKSLEDSFIQYRNLMNKPRYYKVRWANSFDDAAYALQKAGYATDPKYAEQLIDIYNKIIIYME